MEVEQIGAPSPARVRSATQRCVFPRGEMRAPTPDTVGPPSVNGPIGLALTLRCLRLPLAFSSTRRLSKSRVVAARYTGVTQQMRRETRDAG